MTKVLELDIYIERRVDYFFITDLQACFVEHGAPTLRDLKILST